MTTAAQTQTLSIRGYEGECYCDHCGRALQHGVRTDSMGVIGADCFNKLIKANRNRFSGNGKPGASLIRTFARLRERRSDSDLCRMGYSAARSFTFELA